MDEQEILKYIFEKVKDVIDLKPVELGCDNTIILEKLHEQGLMSEQERQYVNSYVTHYDKNK